MAWILGGLREENYHSQKAATSCCGDFCFQPGLPSEDNANALLAACSKHGAMT